MVGSKDFLPTLFANTLANILINVLLNFPINQVIPRSVHFGGSQ